MLAGWRQRDQGAFTFAGSMPAVAWRNGGGKTFCLGI